jgi:protein-serine/threonine kinase
LSYLLDKQPGSRDASTQGDPVSPQNSKTSPLIKARKTIAPSLITLEKAASVRIYFENLYFPLLKHPAAREQRRLAMETGMTGLGFDDQQKDAHRARWRRNESEYLREKRQKIDVSGFIRLKKIGHGLSHSICSHIDTFPYPKQLDNSGSFGVVSLVKEKSTGQLYAMKEVEYQLIFESLFASLHSNFNYIS